MQNDVALRHSSNLMPIENIDRPVSNSPDTSVNNQRTSLAALYSYMPYVTSQLKRMAMIVFIMSIFIIIFLIRAWYLLRVSFLPVATREARIARQVSRL